MELWELPKGSKIYTKCSDGSEYIIFDHPDGMYSYCITEKGALVHPSRLARVKGYKDGFIFI